MPKGIHNGPRGRPKIDPALLKKNIETAHRIGPQSLKEIELSSDKVFQMAKHGLPDKMIAKYYDMDLNYLQNTYERELRVGRIQGREVLARTQFEMAVKSKSIPMLIWLGKQWLSQSEPSKEDTSALKEQAEKMVRFHVVPSAVPPD